MKQDKYVAHVNDWRGFLERYAAQVSAWRAFFKPMKRLFIIVTLAALMLSCGGPAPFRGSVRELVPQQVGEFKLTGEVKAVEVVPPDKNRSGALRPTEGVTARYEAPGAAQLSLQVINYSSAADAEQALKLMQENISKLGNGAKITEGTRTSGEQKTASRKLVIEGVAPGFHQVIWVNNSLLFLASGDNLKALLEFEQGLP